MEINPQPNDPVVLSRMMGILRQLENASELNAKMQLLKTGMDGVPCFRSMLLYALDPYRKYGIQQWTPVQGIKITRVSWDDVAEFLNRCRFVFSGDRRLDALKELQSHMTVNDQELLRRIVLKDLRCGVGATLVNKVFPALIPEFGVMLAQPVEDVQLRQWVKNRPKLYGQAKENGDRLVVMVTRDFRVEAYSRNGHRCHNYKSVESSLSVICQQSQVFRATTSGMVFDGEIIHEDFWGTRSVKKLEGNDAKNAIFHVFDLVRLEDWRKNESAVFSVRNRDLRKMSNEPMWLHYDNVKKVAAFPLELDFTDEDTLLNGLMNYRDALIKDKKEGLIVRLDVEYNYKTRSSMFKLKKMQTEEYMVVEVLRGEKGKKHEHHAGRIVIDLGDGVTCKAGLRCTDLQRDILWQRRADVVGKMAEIQFQEMTKSKTGPPKLQFPIFVRVREDKS